MGKRRFTFLFSLLLLGISSSVMGQEIHHEGHESEGVIELITSGIISYTPSEGETLFGSEAHLTYWWNHTWGAGFSYSARFYETHPLSDIALLGSLNATQWLTINVGPNFALPSEDVRDHLRLGFYAETEFNYRVSEFFHFGLLTGTVINNETEFTTGIQLGFEF